MPIEAEAVYENGALRFDHALPLAENQRVKVSIDPTVTVSNEGQLVSSQIDTLYEEVAKLNASIEKNPADIGLKLSRKHALVELRELQRIEAEAIERRVIQTCSLPLGVGERALQAAYALIEQHENSSVKDRSAE